MGKQRIFLLATGCFNPPTIMHLRIMELARDYLNNLGFNVIGGALTPVHDGYGKKGLVAAHHRVKMLQLALQNNDWVKLSSWEANRNALWTRTRQVCDYHQEKLDALVNGESTETSSEWLPDPTKCENGAGPIKLKIVCGADLLESFNTKNLWQDDDTLKLVRDYGLVVISREGNDPFKSIYLNDILNAHKGNIHVVHEWIRNEISSTRVRCAVRRSQTIKYIVPDLVVDYINKENLYSP